MEWLRLESNPISLPWSSYSEPHPTWLWAIQSWGTHSFSDQPVPVVSPPHSKEFLPYIQSKFTCFSLQHYPCPVTTSLGKKCLSIFLVTFFKYWKAAVRSSWHLLFSRMNNHKSLSLSSCTKRCFGPQTIPWPCFGPALAGRGFSTLNQLLQDPGMFSSGAMDLWMFKSLRGSQTWSSPGDSQPWELWDKHLTVKTETEKVVEHFNLLHVSCHQILNLIYQTESKKHWFI